ncbi:hypothetical protein PM082_012431 [Marasmius tenuissimus]|nr:hypothetical protein PM082_012431 [Marasmius tenuissimus]
MFCGNIEGIFTFMSLHKDTTGSNRFTSMAHIAANGISVALAVLVMVLSLMIGGRIWWIARRTRAVSTAKTMQFYHTIASIVIESGALFCVILIIDVVGHLLPGRRNFVMDSILFQIGGIAPTLIIARINSSQQDLHEHSNSSGWVEEVYFQSAEPQI